MLEDVKKAYYKSKEVRKKYIVIALVVCAVVIGIGITLSSITENPAFIPLSVVFGGLGSYIYYYAKTGGYKHLYGQYFAALKNDLAVNENISINDFARNKFEDIRIKKTFKDFSPHQVNTAGFIQVHVEDVMMDITHTRVMDLEAKYIKPLFDGTVITVRKVSEEDYSYNEDTNYEDIHNPSFLRIVREALGDDVRVVQKENVLYIATTKKISINLYVNEVQRRTFYNPVFHYDDLDKVIDSWRYYKILKKILVN